MITKGQDHCLYVFTQGRVRARWPTKIIGASQTDARRRATAHAVRRRRRAEPRRAGPDRASRRAARYAGLTGLRRSSAPSPRRDLGRAAWQPTRRSRSRRTPRRQEEMFPGSDCPARDSRRPPRTGDRRARLAAAPGGSSGAPSPVPGATLLGRGRTDRPSGSRRRAQAARRRRAGETWAAAAEHPPRGGCVRKCAMRSR